MYTPHNPTNDPLQNLPIKGLDHQMHNHDALSQFSFHDSTGLIKTPLHE